MNRKPVMLVEDNEFDLDMTCHIFDRENVLNDIVVAHDGEEAIDCLFGHGGNSSADIQPVVIILDLNLPGIQGIDVLKRIRNDVRTNKVPVIIFTSSEKTSDRDDSFNAGATDFVMKSGNHRKFTASIKKMIADWLHVKDESRTEEGNVG